MDIKNIVVKEYLESLTEKNELNRIFPMLLEVMGFTILSRPTEYIGLPEYGKDIVAVGMDEDNIKKRFYFELKGGADRDITDANFYGKDGIQDSLTQASYNKFVSAFPEFEQLPLKIVIVHNGIIKGNVQATLEAFIVATQKNLVNTAFDRWDISRLTQLFSEKLFSEYLLVDPQTTRLFNRVVVNLNTTDGISPDFRDLLELLFSKEEWKKSKKLSRRWQVLFETFKLVGFIIYTESKEHNNLETAKRYMTHLVLKFWNWILKNKLEDDKTITGYFAQVFNLYFRVLIEYFKRTLPIASLKDGLSWESSGRYEEIGYAKRTFEYLESYCFFLNVQRFFSTANDKENHLQLVRLINHNNVCWRPLLDIHSSAVISILNLFIDFGEVQNAKNYLKVVLQQLKAAKEMLGFIPDANNSIESVIKFTVTGVKPVYYSDSTSPLLTVLMEYTALLDMEKEYDIMKKFIIDNKIDLGLFVPHHGIDSTSLDLIEDKENDLEEQLFSRSFTDGYQSELRLTQKINDDLNFADFKIKIGKRKEEFRYDYRTDKAGYAFLKDLAHLYFKTPYFPDKWRFVSL